jgi:ATP-dependent helicase YprA (DUF1998 family)
VLPNAEELAQRAAAKAGRDVRKLKRAVAATAAEAGVDIGALANYVAHRLEPDAVNWWGAARNLDRATNDAPALALAMLRERLNLDRLATDDQQLLEGALDPDD